MSKTILLIFIFQIALNTFSICQNISKSFTLDNEIIKSTINLDHNQNNKKRAFIKGKKKNPSYLLIGSLLFLYQNLLSEQISANCLYEISCSEFTKKNIEKHGLIKGLLIGFNQLGSCQKNVTKDLCKHRINSNGKVINVIE